MEYKIKDAKTIFETCTPYHAVMIKRFNTPNFKDNKFYIGKVEAVKVSAKVPEQDRIRLEKYVTQIFDAIRKGYEPAIIQCYDEKEAKVMNKLRDKYRQGK